MDITARYPNAIKQSLVDAYVGKCLAESDTPVAVIDVNAARRNCETMLRACEALGVKFRAHVKTHKTVELTRLQVGENDRPVNLVVSTLAELEFLLPFLKECRSDGRPINVIYGLPVSLSVLSRLTKISVDLGPDSISLLIDSTAALEMLLESCKNIGHPFGIYIKLDTGNNRAGIQPTSEQCSELLAAFGRSKNQRPEIVQLQGFYSHMGISYGSDNTAEALDYLIQEIERCELAAKSARALFPSANLTIAVGATPTATAAQNLLEGQEQSAAVERAKSSIRRVQEDFQVELHAGAYCTLDMQQLAAHSRPKDSNLGVDDIALTIIAEVASLYPHRDPPEALMACGCLSLGRESCRNYAGMGVMTPWTSAGSQSQSTYYDPEGSRTGWIVNRIAQEHGILSWEGPEEIMRALTLGEKVRIWPNHCCIAAAGFGYFLVVDSSNDGEDRDRIVDVWVRCRGW